MGGIMGVGGLPLPFNLTTGPKRAERNNMNMEKYYPVLMI
jgi:hypothetical protein